MAEPRLEYFAGMGDHRAHLRALDRIDALAYDVAQRLGSAVVGPPHLLLAILDERADDSRAAQALGDCGVTSEAAEALARDYARDDRDEAHTPQTNPAFQNLQNMAEGMAAGLGDAEVRAEHVLLAFLWDPNFSAHALSRLGTSREQVRDRLAELGVRLPQSGLPAPDPRGYGPDVYVSLVELRILLHELPYVLPPGASHAWNRDREKGWVCLTEGLEPGPYVAAALERHRRAYFDDAPADDA